MAEMKYAGFIKRFGANFTDGIIILIPSLILSFLLDLRLLQIIAGIIGLAYFVYFEGTTGVTPAKGILKIRVVSADGAKELGFFKAFVRCVGRFIAAIPLYLGYLWIIWDAKKQGWHDKIAGTYVIEQ